MSAPPYIKLDDPQVQDNSSDCPMLDANPPPYSEAPMSPLPKPLPSAGAYNPPVQADNFYPAPVLGSPPLQPQLVSPPQVIQLIPAPPPAPTASTVNVITAGMLPPGTCTVCRMGQIKDSASCCTWLWCLLLLPFGIIPGIIAFCCCCRHPKCNHCGFSV